MEIERLFEQELASRQSEEKIDAGEAYVRQVEQEYLGTEASYQERVSEKKEVQDLLKKKRYLLRKCRNQRGARMRLHNSKMAERRKKLRADITILEVRLKEIETEASAAEADFTTQAQQTLEENRQSQVRNSSKRKKRKRRK